MSYIFLKQTKISNIQKIRTECSFGNNKGVFGFDKKGYLFDEMGLFYIFSSRKKSFKETPITFGKFSETVERER